MKRQSTIQSRLTRRAWIVTTLLATFIVAGTFAASSSSSPAKLHVRVIVDYNDGVQKHFTAIPWVKDMTVLDAMNHARSVAHGISFQHKGSGETALLVKIDDIHNRGREAEGKSWLYWVNTKFADKSFGVQQLNPSDVVLWRYDTYEDD